MMGTTMAMDIALSVQAVATVHTCQVFARTRIFRRKERLVSVTPQGEKSSISGSPQGCHKSHLIGITLCHPRFCLPTRIWGANTAEVRSWQACSTGQWLERGCEMTRWISCAAQGVCACSPEWEVGAVLKYLLPIYTFLSDELEQVYRSSSFECPRNVFYVSLNILLHGGGKFAQISSQLKLVLLKVF